MTLRPTRPRPSPVTHSSPTTTAYAAAYSDTSAGPYCSPPRKGWAIETTSLAVATRGDERTSSAGPGTCPPSWRRPRDLASNYKIASTRQPNPFLMAFLGLALFFLDCVCTESAMIGDGNRYRRGHVAVIDVVVNGEADHFRAECGGNLKALLQHAHVFCAVRNIADVPSCRMQSAVAVINLCYRHERELGEDRNRQHENNTAKTESHSSEQNTCEVRPLSRAVRLYSEQKFAYWGQQHSEALWVLHFVQECSEAGLLLTQGDELRICTCQGKTQSDACQCSQDHVQPIPYVPIPMEDKLQKAWPHAMVVLGKGLDRLDKIVSTMKASNDFSILLIETMDYTDNISNIMRLLFAAHTRKRPLETLILPSPPSVCALILFLDHKPVLTLYGEQGALNNETFANKRVIDLQQQLTATVLRDSPGHKDHIIRLSSLPSEFNTIVKNIPGRRPLHASDYEASHAAFYSPYFLRSNLAANILYEVDIVGIKKLQLACHENATRGSFLFGKTAAVYDFPHSATVGAACPKLYDSDYAQHASMSFESTSFVKDFRGLVDTFDLSQYPQCVNMLGGASRRSYVIVDREYRVLDGAHKVALATTRGATRMEVIVLQRAAVSKATARAVPCAGVLGGVDLDSPTPALRVSLGLRVLAHCGIPYVIMNVFNPLMFPTAQKIGERVDVLTGTTTLEAAECLRSVFPAGRVRAISLSHMHIDLLDGQEAILFVRFNLYSELPYIFHGVHLNWKADILAHSQTRLSPLGFEWSSPSAMDSAAMHYLEWVDWHKLKPDCIKHLQWVANHPNIMFPLPDASFRLPGTKKRYRTMQVEGTGDRNVIMQLSEPRCILPRHSPQMGQAIPMQIVVFSWNQPSQLLLLLRSLERHVVDWKQVPITVIVSASDECFVESYILLQRKYQCVQFLWNMEQELFHEHIMSVLSNANAKLTFTLSGNSVFVRQVALSDLAYAAKFENLSFLSVSRRVSKFLHVVPEVKRYHFSQGRIENLLDVWDMTSLAATDVNEIERKRFYSLASSVQRTETLKTMLQAQTEIFSSFNHLSKAHSRWHVAAGTKVSTSLIGTLGTKPCVTLMPNIQDVHPFSLHLMYRFDIIVKTVYAIEYLKDGNISTLVRNIYLEHLRVWNNVSEPCTFEGEADWFDTTKPCIVKSSEQDFESSFQRILYNLRKNGFDSSLSLVPLSNAMYPLDGAHRVAASIALDMGTMPVQKTSSDKWFMWDENFFKKKGFNPEYVDIVWSRFMKHVSKTTTSTLNYLENSKENMHAVVLFPSVRNMLLDKVKALLAKHTRRITERTFWLATKSAADMFVQQIYPGEYWVSEGAWGKTRLCFPKGTEVFPVRVTFVATASPLSDMLKLKAHIRELYMIGKSSIHISDTKSQAIDIAKIVLNTNSLAYLNRTTWSSPSQRKHVACQPPDNDDTDEKHRYYLDGNPCALGEVYTASTNSTEKHHFASRKWSSYAQSKILRELSRGCRKAARVFPIQSKGVDDGNKSAAYIYSPRLEQARGWDGLWFASTPSPLLTTTRLRFPPRYLQPVSAFRLLSKLLSVGAETTKQVGHGLALRYNGSLQEAVSDMCAQWRYKSDAASCYHEIVDALDRYSPLFSCIRHGHSFVEAATAANTVVNHRKLCLSAKVTVIRHLKKLGLWGWASILYERHKKDGLLSRLAQVIASPNAPEQLVEEINPLLAKSMQAEAVHIVRVRVSIILYYEFAHRRHQIAIPRDITEIMVLLVGWLAKIEFAYSGFLVSTALQCLRFQLGAHKNVEYPKFFRETLGWCGALAEKPKSHYSFEDEGLTNRNPLQEGAHAVFSDQNSLPRNRVIARDIVPTSTLIMPTSEKTPQSNAHTGHRLLVGVMSKPSHGRRRDGIRETWGSHCRKDGISCDLVFVLGALSKRDIALDRQVQEEQRQYGDLLWIKVNPEGMRKNFTRKVGSFFSYALHLQRPHVPSLVLRTDDDVYVNVRGILKEARWHKAPVYWGNKCIFEETHREGKYEMRQEEFASDVYPPFMSGGRQVLSRDLLEILIVRRPLQLSTHSLDDVDIGIQLTDVVDGVHDERFFPAGQCAGVIAVAREGGDGGGTDFFVCESRPSFDSKHSDLEREWAEMFALGY